MKRDFSQRRKGFSVDHAVCAIRAGNTIAWGLRDILAEMGVMINFRAVVTGAFGATLTNTTTLH